GTTPGGERPGGGRRRGAREPDRGRGGRAVDGAAARDRRPAPALRRADVGRCESGCGV
ncbi:MAG: hypothetical protein AVDCRST_MAG19-2616, partial [uncultured Thermomicrobiales bacterium]